MAKKRGGGKDKTPEKNRFLKRGVMKKETIKKIKILNMATYPGAIITLYFLYPVFIKFNENIKYALAWFSVAGIGVIILNHRFLSIIEKAKDTSNLLDFLSTWGRAKIRNNPDNYFTPEIYKQYKNNFRYMLIYMGISGVALFLIVFLFIQKGN